jgi:hypothetical protein
LKAVPAASTIASGSGRRTRRCGASTAGRCGWRIDRERIRTAYEALRRKYGWQMWLADFFSRLSGRIDQRAILELDV